MQLYLPLELQPFFNVRYFPLMSLSLVSVKYTRCAKNTKHMNKYLQDQYLCLPYVQFVSESVNSPTITIFNLTSGTLYGVTQQRYLKKELN